ncbi:MAG: hypothetical protein IPJ65_03550 [Archangiaceae bacterium]|nr:hypothetical protein [Archangiaceae bacterium]
MVEAGARCSLHVDALAAGTCARCGRFMCVSCSTDDDSRCADCFRERWGALGRHPFALRTAFNEAGRLISANVSTMLALALVMAIVQSVVEENLVSLRWEARFLVIIIEIFVSTAGTAMLMLVLRNTTTGLKVNAWSLAGECAERLGVTFVATLKYNAALAFGVLAFVYPGLRWACEFVLCQQVAVLEPHSPPLRTSSELTQGHRLELLLVATIGLLFPLGFGGVTDLATVMLRQAGHETWHLALASSTVDALFSLSVDVLLFCAYVQLRYGPGGKPLSR